MVNYLYQPTGFRSKPSQLNKDSLHRELPLPLHKTWKFGCINLVTLLA